jgi:hypothetical protein
MGRSSVRSSAIVSLDHLNTVPDAVLRNELQRLMRVMIFGTLAERGRVCGKPTCRCARGEKHPAVQLAHWAGDGKTRSQHVPYAVMDTVRAGVDAWHRFQAIARELADRNRAQVWTRARRRGEIR